jgi:hypothetical protein
MELLQECHSILADEDYATRFNTSRPNQLFFEDVSLLGFVLVYDKVDQLLAEWEGQQDRFLELNANRLRLSAEKSWNVYSVFITGDTPSQQQLSALAQVEENFRGTRKIARAAILTPSALKRVLLPLLSIQNLVRLQSEDALLRLRSHIPLLPEALDMLFGDLPAQQIAQYLINKASSS